MKKILYSLALVAFGLFTACEPECNEESYGTATMKAEDLNLEVVVEQQNGHNVNKVQVYSHNPLSSYITYMFYTTINTYAEYILRNTGENVIYVHALNGNGEIIKDSVVVTCDELFYELPPAEITLWSGTKTVDETYNGDKCRFSTKDFDFDKLKGMKIYAEITPEGDDCEISIRSGWWDVMQLDFTVTKENPIVTFTLSDKDIDALKEHDISFIGTKGNFKVTRFYVAY